MENETKTHKKWKHGILWAVAFIVVVMAASSEGVTTMNFLTKGWADTLYCSISGGCNSSTEVANYLVDFMYMDFATDCEVKTNINVSNTVGLCSAGYKESFIYYESGWNLLCCDFNTECGEYNYTTYDNICDDSMWSGYSVYSSEKWMNICCDENGKHCWLDNNITVGDNNTVCDNSFNIPIMNLFYNNTAWNSTCCFGGITE